MKTLHLLPIVAAFLCLSSSPVRAEAGWTTNFEKATDQAKSENKAVLLNFTGSDWCPWCIKMDKETFTKPEFRNYAKANLVCVTLDFPDQKVLSGPIKAQNEKLAKQYKVTGYPTFILLRKDGKILWQGTYMAGGPPAFLAEIGKVYHPAPVTVTAPDPFDAAFKKPAQ